MCENYKGYSHIREINLLQLDYTLVHSQVCNWIVWLSIVYVCHDLDPIFVFFHLLEHVGIKEGYYQPNPNTKSHFFVFFFRCFKRRGVFNACHGGTMWIFPLIKLKTPYEHWGLMKSMHSLILKIPPQILLTSPSCVLAPDLQEACKTHSHLGSSYTHAM